MVDLQGFEGSLLSGLYLTIKITACSLILGLFLGFLGAMAKTSKNRFLYFLGSLYSTIVRGIPEIVWVLLIYFGGTIVLNYLDWGINLDPFVAGVLALGLCFGAYATEVIRGALNSIDIGQYEAGDALGLNKFNIYYSLIIPQTWRLAFSGLSNLFLILMKDTALVSVIGLNELMRVATSAIAFTKAPFTFYMTISIIYLLMTSISMILLNYLDTKQNIWVK